MKDLVNPSYKKGDKLRLLWFEPGSDRGDPGNGYYGHYVGDVGTVVDFTDNAQGIGNPLVDVPGRMGTGFKPYTSWDEYTRFENVTRELKINTLLGL